MMLKRDVEMGQIAHSSKRIDMENEDDDPSGSEEGSLSPTSYDTEDGTTSTLISLGGRGGAPRRRANDSSDGSSHSVNADDYPRGSETIVNIAHMWRLACFILIVALIIIIAHHVHTTKKTEKVLKVHNAFFKKLDSLVNKDLTQVIFDFQGGLEELVEISRSVNKDSALPASPPTSAASIKLDDIIPKLIQKWAKSAGISYPNTSEGIPNHTPSLTNGSTGGSLSPKKGDGLTPHEGANNDGDMATPLLLGYEAPPIPSFQVRSFQMPLHTSYPHVDPKKDSHPQNERLLKDWDLLWGTFYRKVPRKQRLVISPKRIAAPQNAKPSSNAVELASNDNAPSSTFNGISDDVVAVPHSMHWHQGQFHKRVRCRIKPEDGEVPSSVLITLIPASYSLVDDVRRLLENWVPMFLASNPMPVRVFFQHLKGDSTEFLDIDYAALEDLKAEFAPIRKGSPLDLKLLPTDEDNSLENLNRGVRMNYFLGSGVYVHPEIVSFDYVVRFDSDFTFLQKCSHNLILQMHLNKRWIGYSVLGMPEMGAKDNPQFIKDFYSWMLFQGTLVEGSMEHILEGDGGMIDTLYAGPFEIFLRKVFASDHYQNYFESLVEPYLKLNRAETITIREQFFKSIYIRYMVPPIRRMWFCEIAGQHKVNFPARCLLTCF